MAIDETTGSALKTISWTIGITVSVVTLIFQVVSVISEQNASEAKIKQDILSFQQELNKDFRAFVTNKDNKEIIFGGDSTELKKYLSLMRLTFPDTLVYDFMQGLKEVVHDSVGLKVVKNELDKQALTANRKMGNSRIGNCNSPYPRGRSEPSTSQNKYIDQDTWFVVIASLYTESAAKRFVENVRDLVPGYEVKIFKATDSNRDVAWAVTIGSNLDNEEAKKRVCEAQTTLGLRADSYIWATTEWK